MARSADDSERRDTADSMLWDLPRQSGGRGTTKAERLRRDAAGLGVTEPELKPRRRESAQRDQLRSAEAPPTRHQTVQTAEG
jgi:hypothetical protein